MLIRDDETIIAQCTPSGSGALALIRLSGSDALSIAHKISKNNIQAAQTHTIQYGSIVHQNGDPIDQVLFLIMRGPKTFTGQDTVEITCHNNPFIIQAIIERAIQAGARIADKGEFTKRALLNKKIDLLQAEAINELIHANTQQALKKSLGQLKGTFSHWIAQIEKQLIKSLALSEASFEFIDEEDMEFGNQIKQIINQIAVTITQLKKMYNQQQQIRNGIRIALIGSVNAGKSSLFNMLIGDQRAIVTEIAGTTRDAIEAGLYKNGNYWTLIDTAGLRNTNNKIEQQGIERSYDEAKKADIILLVVDQSRNMNSEEQFIYEKIYIKSRHKCIIIGSKNDLAQKHVAWLENKKLLSCSYDDAKSIGAIEQEIYNKITELFSSIESPFLINTRHYNLLLKLEHNLDTINQLLAAEIDYELVSFHLNEALSGIAELTGKTISEAGMDAVFREFCVGK